MTKTQLTAFYKANLKSALSKLTVQQLEDFQNCYDELTSNGRDDAVDYSALLEYTKDWALEKDEVGALFLFCLMTNVQLEMLLKRS